MKVGSSWSAAALFAVVACLAWSAPALAASVPVVEEEFASDVASASATLEAKVNPGGEETTYRFEYGTSEAYGSSAPVPDGLVGVAESGTLVGAHVQGLAARTTYHYRVVAHSALGTVDGEDLTFTTQSTGGELVLPDGREWEMVSPPDKHGAKLEPISEEEGLVVASAGGEAFTYVSRIPMESEPRGFAASVQNLAVRGATGWRSQGLTVPHGGIAGVSAGNGPEYRFFSSDLAHAIVQPLGPFTPCRLAEGAEEPCLSPEASEQTAFLTSDYLNGNVAEPCLAGMMGCARPLVSGCPGAGVRCAPVVAEHADAPAGTVFGGEYGYELGLSRCAGGTRYCGPYFEAASPDLSHVVIEARASLATGGTPGSQNLYEWAAGKLTFVGTGKVGGRKYDLNPEVGIRPVSDDGSRVVFDGSSEGLEGLLMRDTATGETVDLAPGDTSAPSFASFQAANASGSRVFFIAGGESREVGGELYVFEATEGSRPLAGKVSDLTSGVRVEGSVLGVSEDGSYVYFLAGGVLPGSGAPGPGEDLYVDHYDGSGWKPTFIAALSGEDSQDWVADTFPALSAQPTRVSPDGEWLAFMSQAPLTGYDNRDALSGQPDAEVYLYDAGANRLVCASCDPTGERPIGVEYRKLEWANGGLAGSGAWQEHGLVAANVPGWQQTGISGFPENYQSRYLSNSGRLFFDSADALVPQDVNGTEDVYEYEPAGVGGCVVSLATYSARSNGCVGLVSSGISPEESAFLDASESGGDVFFLSSARLVPQDVETSLSLYDARECTVGAPCVSVAVSPPACETEATCRAAPAPPPAVFGAPASATLAGGSLAAAVAQSAQATKTTGRKGSRRRACAKGGRLRRGRCVRSKARAARQGAR